jgi:hypothetical protein
MVAAHRAAKVFGAASPSRLVALADAALARGLAAERRVQA